ncbi:hypothetical protein COCVIDRAFT_103658, partial [Bipolaris victoriae FI3]
VFSVIGTCKSVWNAQPSLHSVYTRAPFIRFEWGQMEKRAWRVCVVSDVTCLIISFPRIFCFIDNKYEAKQSGFRNFDDTHPSSLHPASVNNKQHAFFIRK